MQHNISGRICFYSLFWNIIFSIFELGMTRFMLIYIGIITTGLHKYCEWKSLMLRLRLGDSSCVKEHRQPLQKNASLFPCRPFASVALPRKRVCGKCSPRRWLRGFPSISWMKVRGSEAHRSSPLVSSKTALRENTEGPFPWDSAEFDFQFDESWQNPLGCHHGNISFAPSEKAPPCKASGLDQFHRLPRARWRRWDTHS